VQIIQTFPIIIALQQFHHLIAWGSITDSGYELSFISVRSFKVFLIMGFFKQTNKQK